MPTPVRTIRVDDETWDATRERAEKEETTVSDIVRAALRRYLGVVLVAVALILSLSACGGSAPAAAPSASPTTPTLDQAREQVQAEASASAEAAIEAKARAAAGLCTATHGGTPYVRNQPEGSVRQDEATLDAYRAWLVWLQGAPEGCTAKDRQRLAASLAAAEHTIDLLESGALG